MLQRIQGFRGPDGAVNQRLRKFPLHGPNNARSERIRCPPLRVRQNSRPTAPRSRILICWAAGVRSQTFRTTTRPDFVVRLTMPRKIR
jgi:hypothetical protein